MTNHRRIQLLSLAVTLAATSAHAADAPPLAARTEAYGPGGPHSPVDAPGVSVTAEAGQSDAKASFALVFQGQDAAKDLQARVEVSHAPSGDRLTDLLTLDGVASGTSLSLSVAHLFWRPKTDVTKVAAVCQEILKKDGCTRLEIPKERRREFDIAIDYGVPVWVALTGKAAYQKLDWVASGTLAPDSTPAVDLGSELRVGLYADGVGTFAGAFQLKREFQPGQAVQICTPVMGTPGAESCQTASLDEPTTAVTAAVELEYRKFISNQLAFNPVVGLDLGDRAITARTNIYIFPSTDGGLAGGVSLGWRSSDNAVLASVFISERLPFAY